MGVTKKPMTNITSLRGLTKNSIERIVEQLRNMGYVVYKKDEQTNYEAERSFERKVRMLAFAESIDSDSSDPSAIWSKTELLLAESDGEANANLITSLVKYHLPNAHYPLLDIDNIYCNLMPSSTSGHFHLSIHKAVSWDDYKMLMVMLANMGIIEQGYCDASIQRGYSAIRSKPREKPRPYRSDLDS